MSDHDSLLPITVAKGVALLLTALALHGVALAQAQTNKCVGADGRTTYSSLPCAQGDQAKTLVIQANAPPPAPNAKPDVEAARQRERQAFEAYEAKRNAKLAQSRANDKERDAANARVRQIKVDNYNPQKCAAARSGAQRIYNADPLMAGSNVDYFDMKQKAELYCGP